jgi:ABC-type uncharacterized transport system substrate-binding protein
VTFGHHCIPGQQVPFSPSIKTARVHHASWRRVFVNISDPIDTGVLSNLARPGGRATGFTNFEASMAEKWLELLKEVAPGIERFGILGNSQSPSSSMFVRTIEAAANAMRMPAKNFFVSDDSQIEQQVMAVADEPRGGLVVLPDALFGARRANSLRWLCSDDCPQCIHYVSGPPRAD